MGKVRHSYLVWVLIVLIGSWLALPVEAFEEHMIDIPRYGDITQDRRIDLSDAIRLLQHLFTGQTLEGGSLGLADTNADGKIDISDPINILQYLFSREKLSPISQIGINSFVREDQLPVEINQADIVFIQPEEGNISYGNLEPSDQLDFRIIKDPENDRFAVGYELLLKNQTTNQELVIFKEDNRPKPNSNPPSGSVSSYSKVMQAVDKATIEAKSRHQGETAVLMKKQNIDSDTPGLIEIQLNVMRSSGEIQAYQRITELEAGPDMSPEFNFIYEVSGLKFSGLGGQDHVRIVISKQMNYALTEFIKQLDELKDQGKISGYALREEDQGRIIYASLFNPGADLPEEMSLDLAHRSTVEAMQEYLKELIEQLTTGIKDSGLTLAIKSQYGFDEHQLIARKGSASAVPAFSLLNYINLEDDLFHGRFLGGQKGNADNSLIDLPQEGQGAVESGEAPYRNPYSNSYVMFALEDDSESVRGTRRRSFQRIDGYLTSVRYHGLFFYGNIDNPIIFPAFWIAYNGFEDGLGFISGHGSCAGNLGTGWFRVWEPKFFSLYGYVHILLLNSLGLDPYDHLYQSPYDGQWYQRVAVTPRATKRRDMNFISTCYGHMVGRYLMAREIIASEGMSNHGDERLFTVMIDSMTGGVEGTNAALSSLESFLYAKRVTGVQDMVLKNSIGKHFVLYPYLLSEDFENGWTGDDWVFRVHLSVHMAMLSGLRSAFEVDTSRSNVKNAYIPPPSDIIDHPPNPDWIDTNTIELIIGGDPSIPEKNWETNLPVYIKVKVHGEYFEPLFKRDYSLKLHGNTIYQANLKGLDRSGHHGQRPLGHDSNATFEDAEFYIIIQSKDEDEITAKLCYEDDAHLSRCFDKEEK